MSLSGNLHTMPLADLLQWIGSARKTGTLAVRGARYTKRLYIKEGRIISSASEDPTEHLGQFLLSRGRITEEHLRKGLETQARTHVLLGKILLMTGALQEEELKDLLRTKAEETIFSLFLWTDAHFDFADGDLPRELFVPVSLDVQDVLLRGLAMCDELRHIRAEFGSMRSVPGRTSRQPAAGALPGGPLTLALLGLVDGKRSIADLCLALHASEYALCQCLYQLYEQRYVRLVERTEPGPAPTGPASRPFVPADTLVRQAGSLLARGDYASAVDLLAQAVEISPRDLEIKRLYDESCGRFRDWIYRDVLPPYRIPVLVLAMNQLTRENLTPEEGFLISRINGSWDLKSIIDISPLGEVEALRILKRLKDRGIIVLR